VQHKCAMWVLQVMDIEVSDPQHWPLKLSTARGLEALYRSRTVFVQRRMCPVNSRDDPLGPVPVSLSGQPRDGADLTELSSLAAAEPHVAAFAQACSCPALDPVIPVHAPANHSSSL